MTMTGWRDLFWQIAGTGEAARLERDEAAMRRRMDAHRMAERATEELGLAQGQVQVLVELRDDNLQLTTYSVFVAGHMETAVPFTCYDRHDPYQTVLRIARRAVPRVQAPLPPSATTPQSIPSPQVDAITPPQYQNLTITGGTIEFSGGGRRIGLDFNGAGGVSVASDVIVTGGGMYSTSMPPGVESWEWRIAPSDTEGLRMRLAGHLGIDPSDVRIHATRRDMNILSLFVDGSWREGGVERLEWPDVMARADELAGRTARAPEQRGRQLAIGGLK